ncbi:protein kinase [Catenulispora sp. NF23]|uniref:non-specific serine/threonine protein kinase n=1 Tax=Catenulispora pinistramenti TaxID=2705254 RepID=A0ABS5KYB4_9ACTN|nr:serine/threonine-protein kinase [Catenulispora pinistramenti]MBS2536903.1 protein kinase [Catenulispora pinistramenti]MBS2551061.1 protein kinase [Catenulispora pinistramenti]
MTQGRLIAGRYRLDVPLGRGGMGEVWRAYDERLDRHVAVKLIFAAQTGRLSADAGLARRFARECRALARVDHPGVVTIHDAGRDPDRDGGELFLVMQRIDGMSLADFIAENEDIPWAHAAALGAQIATVLTVVHAIPVVHRDLKPSNVMVRPDGTAVLLDLGVAAVFDPDLSKLTRTGESLGSPGYMAPEQASAGLAGPQSDLYALGCVLHEVLTGEPVFRAPTPYALFAKHAGEAPTPVRAHRPDLPEALEQLILELLAKQPQARPGSAREVHQRLVAMLPRPETRATDSPFNPLRPFHVPMAPPPDPRSSGGGPGLGGASAPPLVPPRPAQVDLATALAEAEKLIGEGRYTPAVQILAVALAQAERTHDPHGPVVRSLRKQYARILLLDGRLGPAQTEFTRLARVAAADHGRDSAEALNFRLQAAQCREQSGDVSGALAEYQSILPLLLQLPNPDQQRVLMLRDRIGRLLIAAGRSREAWQVLLGVLQEKERLLGPQHPDSVVLRGTLAQLAQGPSGG